MRICYIGDLSNIHTRRWVRFFGNSGHDVHVISTKPAGKVELSDVKVYWLLSHRTGSYLMDLILGFSSIPAHVCKLRRLFREIHPDVVHIHYLNEAAVFALLTGFRPIVLTAWGSDILLSPEKSWIRRQTVKYTLKRLNLMTCDADHMKQKMVSLGADPDKVKLIFFGTDVQRFHPGRRDPSLRERLAPGDAPVVISTRKLEPIYDIETLIRAVPGVLARFPTARFWIGGSGPLAESLRALAAKLGVDDSVRFLGALSEEELPAYLASSDVYVSTAVSDAGIAASTAEAMACGTPVVITDVAANSEWVENGKQGFLVRARDAHMLGESIARLLESPDLRVRMGRAARQVIVERNNLQKEMLKMEGLYQELSKAREIRGAPHTSPNSEQNRRVEKVC